MKKVMTFPSNGIILQSQVFSATLPLSLPSLFLIHTFHLDFLVTFAVATFFSDLAPFFFGWYIISTEI